MRDVRFPPIADIRGRLHDREMTSPTDLKSAFLTAAYGKLTPHLLKYSADLDGQKVCARIVVHSEIGEDELETLFEILGDTIGHTGGTATFELVRVPSLAEAASDPELSVRLFRAFSLDAQH